jgi:hypothetical protein
MLFSAKTFHRTSANFNFIHDKRRNVCVDIKPDFGGLLESHQNFSV